MLVLDGLCGERDSPCAVRTRGGGGTFSGKRESCRWRVGLAESSSEGLIAAKRKANDFAPSLLLLSIDGSSLGAETHEFCKKDDGGLAERNGRARCPMKLDTSLPFCRTLRAFCDSQL